MPDSISSEGSMGSILKSTGSAPDGKTGQIGEIKFDARMKYCNIGIYPDILYKDKS